MNELQHTASVAETARELLRLLDEALPHISDAITIATIHGCSYSGPRLDRAADALRHALDQ